MAAGQGISSSSCLTFVTNQLFWNDDKSCEEMAKSDHGQDYAKQQCKSANFYFLENKEDCSRHKIPRIDL